MAERQEMQDAPEPPRQRISEAKHTAILEAALEVFLKHGFSRAAMVDIADNAGVSTATLYKHFRSKEELFAAIVDHKLADVDNELDASVFDLPPEDAIVAIARNYLRLQFEGGMNALTRVVIAEAPINSELGRDFYDRVVTRRQQALAAYLDIRAASGELDVPDATGAARLIIGFFKELFVWPALFDPAFRPPADAEEQARAGARRFVELWQRPNNARGTGTQAGE